MAVSPATQAKIDAAVKEQVDAAVAAAVQGAKVGLVVAASKPHEIDNLRKTWRASAEHKAAQVKLFLSTLIGLVGLQAVGDFAAGKDLSHLLDVRALLTYLAPFALVAWRQLHPSLTASQADSAQGMTIVPEQTQAGGDNAVDNAPPERPLDGDAGDPFAPEGDAAP